MGNGRINKRVMGETEKMGITIAGKIKIGEKHPQKGYPMSLDYFKCTSTNKQYEEMFAAVCGANPKVLKIVFMSDNFAEVCPQFYELRDASGKVYARGDGENFEIAVKHGEKVNFMQFTEEQIIAKKGSIENFMQEAATACRGQWKERLSLRFLIVGIPITGYWELTTFGKDSSIISIVQQIDTIFEKTGGRLRDIPFDLMVEKHKSDKAGDARQYPVLKLVCNYSPDDIQAVAALPMSGYHGILTSEKLKGLNQNKMILLDNGVEDAEIIPE
jgi:hypothetical protein